MYVADNDSDRVMVCAADFNAAMGMNEQSGIKHSFLQDMKSELSNKRRRKQIDRPSADKMYEIVGSGYSYEYLVDERVSSARLTGANKSSVLQTKGSSLFLIHILVAVSWARTKLNYLAYQPSPTAAVRALRISANAIGQLIRWNMASTIKISVECEKENTTNTSTSSTEKENEKINTNASAINIHNEKDRERKIVEDENEKEFLAWQKRPSERTLPALFIAEKQQTNNTLPSLSIDNNGITQKIPPLTSATHPSIASISIPSLQGLCNTIHGGKFFEDATTLKHVIASLKVWTSVYEHRLFTLERLPPTPDVKAANDERSVMFLLPRKKVKNEQMQMNTTGTLQNKKHLYKCTI